MATRKFEEAMKNVSAAFGSPREILETSELTNAQQIKLLSEWEYDLRLQLVASEENMASTKPGRAADLLTEVRACLQELGQELPTEAATKTGGG